MKDVIEKGRPALLSFGRWWQRILLWTAALSVGVAAVVFARMADIASGFLQGLLEQWPLAIWALAPVGFTGIAWLTRRYFAGAEGSGIPQTIYALQNMAQPVSIALLRLRVVAGRMVLAAGALLCGASIGREGPTVHVGAAIANAFARWLPHGDSALHRRAFVLAGGAAGVAAAFNTPLAGIVFAIEELARSFEERASGAMLTAVVLAGVVAIALIGDHAYFGQPVLLPGASKVSVGTLAVALAGGVCGGLFSRITLNCTVRAPAAFVHFRKRRPLLLAALCGLVVAAVGWSSHGLTYGTGYLEARSILENGAHLPWFYAPARAAGMLASYLSGVPAGLLAPSLSVGAGIGQTLADLFGEPSAVPFAMLGMCAYLAAVTQAPLTSFVIVMEMTGSHALIFPLMLSATIATASSRLLSPPLYRTLAERYAPAATSTELQARAAPVLVDDANNDDDERERPQQIKRVAGFDVRVDERKA